MSAVQAPLLARPYYGPDDPGPLVGVLAHVPELLDSCMPFLGAVFGPTALLARTKELAILRTSALLGCRYCTEVHSLVALEAGLSGDELLAVSSTGAAAFDDPADVALLDWVDAVAGAAGPVEPDVWRALVGYFTDSETVEITLLVCATLMLNRFCTALDLPTSAETRRRLVEAGLG